MTPTHVDTAIPHIATGQDGVFTRSQARTAGWSDDRQRSLLASGVWVRVAGPVLIHSQMPLGPWQRARAVALTSGLVVSHHTAGALWGLSVPESLHGTGHVKRLGSPIVCHRLDLADDEVLTVAGLQVTSAARTLTDLMCALPQDPAVHMVTSAMQQGLITPVDLTDAAAAARGRTGAPRARALADSCRNAPHSYLEWLFHGMVGSLDPGWRFNIDIQDVGGFVGRVDAVHEETKIIVELDGQQFHGPETFQSDRTRDQRLAALGYVVLRITWEDLRYRPMEVVARIQATQRLRRHLIMSAA